MSFCSNCGRELAENEVCGCMGGVKPETTNTGYGQGRVVTSVQQVCDLDNMVLSSAKYKPISMWGYFGYQLLFCIPCVGFIFLIVFALGGTSNVNLKNFARSYFCMLIIALILFAVILVLGGSAGVMAAIMEG